MYPRITVDDTPAKTINARAKQLEQRLNRDIEQALAPLRQEMINVMSAEPPVWRGRRRWNSERQRRFVLAKLRREGNLPYRRTHQLSQAWLTVLLFTAQQGVLRLENKAPQAVYVQGSRAQLMHLDSKWPQINANILRFQDAARTAVVKAWLGANRLDD